MLRYISQNRLPTSEHVNDVIFSCGISCHCASSLALSDDSSRCYHQVSCLTSLFAQSSRRDERSNKAKLTLWLARRDHLSHCMPSVASCSECPALNENETRMRQCSVTNDDVCWHRWVFEWVVVWLQVYLSLWLCWRPSSLVC